MNREDLINSLIEDLTPVQVLPPIGTRLVIWFFGSLFLITFLMLAIQSFRPGFLGELLHPRFLLECLALFAASLLGGYVLLTRSIPGLGQKRGLNWTVWILSGYFIGSILIGLSGSPSLPPSMLGKRMTCIYEILILSWIPLGMILFEMKRGYAIASTSTFLTMGIVSVAFPVALMQFACMYDPIHIVKYHIVPALIVITTFLTGAAAMARIKSDLQI